MVGEFTFKGRGPFTVGKDETSPEDKALLERNLIECRVAELKAALSDCIPFVAIVATKHMHDNDLTELHPTHAAVLDRASTLTGGKVLSTLLAKKST